MAYRLILHKNVAFLADLGEFVCNITVVEKTRMVFSLTRKSEVQMGSGHRKPDA